MTVRSAPQYADRLALRWTVGDVHSRGYELLRLSITCASHIFGPAAKYLVCVNEISVTEAKNRTGPIGADVEWRQVARSDMPCIFREYFEDDMIAGMGWKLVPLRTCPDRHELALDNDCVLWELPDAIVRWLQTGRGVVIAEDVERYLGSFESLCPPGAFNAGIRGLAKGVDLLESLSSVLSQVRRLIGGKRLVDEIEEQGLQAAALCQCSPLHLVRTDEVSICSPFWPRSPELGRCGAHFVGINAHSIPWSYYHRPADAWLADHWRRHRQELYRRAGIEPLEECTGSE
jgi:hypothetical protein